MNKAGVGNKDMILRDTIAGQSNSRAAQYPPQKTSRYAKNAETVNFTPNFILHLNIPKK